MPFKLSNESSQSRFTQLFEHSREKSAYAIVSYFNGSLMYDVFEKKGLWTNDLHEAIIEEYVEVYGMDSEFMEQHLHESRDDYWLTK